MTDCRACNNYKFEKLDEGKFRAKCLLGKSMDVNCDFFEGINPLYEEEDDENIDELEINTIKETINDYKIADEEYKRKLKTLENFHKTDREVFETVIRKNFNLTDDEIIRIDDNSVEIYFRDGISFNVFSKLENSGLVYTVFTDNTRLCDYCALRIQFGKGRGVYDN